MRESSRDIERLKHIKKAIEQLLETKAKFSIEELKSNVIVYYGVVKLIEIIGEAAFMLTNEFKDNHSLTPWKQIIGMRHVLVHGYYQIVEEDVWIVLENDLPQLLLQIDEYISELSDKNQ